MFVEEAGSSNDRSVVAWEQIYGGFLFPFSLHSTLLRAHLMGQDVGDEYEAVLLPVMIIAAAVTLNLNPANHY